MQKVNARNLRELAEKNEIAFNFLLEHATGCSDCRRLIDDTFPDGFSSPEGRKRLEEGLRRASAEADRMLAEEGSAGDNQVNAEPGGGGG